MHMLFKYVRYFAYHQTMIDMTTIYKSSLFYWWITLPNYDLIIIICRGVGYEVDVSNSIMQNIYDVFWSIFYKNYLFNKFWKKKVVSVQLTKMYVVAMLKMWFVE